MSVQNQSKLLMYVKNILKSKNGGGPFSFSRKVNTSLKVSYEREKQLR